MKKNLQSIIAIALVAFTTMAFYSDAGLVGIITGSVKDAQSGEDIPFANIIVQDKAGKAVAGAASDFDGNFIIKSVPVGTWDLKVSFVGYQNYMMRDIVVLEGKTLNLNIKLSGDHSTLQEVVVVEDEVAYDLAPAHTISRAEIKSMPMMDRDVRGSRNGRAFKRQLNTVPAAPRYYQGTEDYDEIAENEYKSAKKEPLSTFSIDVDAASYANVRRFINENQAPPADAVRIEEMINYFQYDYPNPKGEHPFSIITEMSECPWNEGHKLVHVGLQGKRMETEDLPPNNLVFLIDVSGSMSSYNKLSLVKQSLKLLVKNLRPQDRVAIAVYAGAAGLVLESTSGSEKEKITDAIMRLQSGGSTAGGAGIQLAYKEAVKNFNAEGNNRVILCTDGDFNVGVSSDDALVSLIEEKRKTGVYLTVLGYGMGNYKDSKMEKLADKGNGNYAYIDNIMEAKKVLVNEMGATLLTIAKDVKIQVEFNPALVESYKLIGYENRLLAAEDFNNDAKDAGELGAGHSVTALYEVIPKGSSSPYSHSVDPLRYQNQDNKFAGTVNNEFDKELMTVKFRYKPPSSSKSKLITKHLQDENIPLNHTSIDFKFSAAVAEFGMLLRKSKFKGTANYSNVVLMAKAGKGKDVHGYRAEFIRLVEQMELQASN